MLTRRHLLASPAGLALPGIARAATRSIGWVSPESRETTAPFFEALNAALRDSLRGDVVRIVERYAPRGPDDIAAAVADLEAQGVALIVTQGAATPPGARAAKKVPIVFAFSGDPVVAGIAQSLARPGGNATGITFMSVELMAKRIDFLRRAAPASRRLALLSNANHPGEEREIAACRSAVEPAGVELSVHRVKAPGEIAPTVERALQEAEALLVLPSSTMVRAAPAMAAQCLVRKAPLVSGWASIAHAGGLMTYGPNLQSAYRRLAFYVVRVLGGASPADLPIEQPTSFELVLNRRTANAIGLRLPDTLVAQAEEVIE
ncbi:MAG TPA: ABC transporter substrate-binding protein [Reyranella sp.]|nr:ABC transporter substrate-binding protein [Reyranella sp.]